MGFEGASGFHPPNGGGGGGTIGGGGTVNYIPVFKPDGVTLADSILYQEPASDPTVLEKLNSAKITTVDGAGPPATNTLQTIPIPLNTVVLIESYITCRKTAGAGIGAVGAGNGYVRTVKAQNIAGVVTIGVVQSSFTSEVVATNNATFDVLGTNVRLRINGSTNNTFNWNVITKTYESS